MNSFAANPTGKGARNARAVVLARSVTPQEACVEDLNWPMPAPPSDKKAPRAVEMWVPGRNVDWRGPTHTLQ